MESGSAQAAGWKDVTFRTRSFPVLELPASETRESSQAPFPDRYLIHNDDSESWLGCREAPTLRVRVESGYSMPSLKNAKPGSIFLDGAAQSAPEVDTERGVLNLDHHQGCVRAFTLATCEQAFVLLSKGLDLQDREWTVYANEPDLDTVLALWVLLNHRRIGNAEVASLMPLIRLLRMEGAIDSHGLEWRHLCGFDEKVAADTFAQLEMLREAELELKQDGRWEQADFAEFAAGQLRRIDRLLLEADDLDDSLTVEELARTSLGDGKLAIGCSSDDGIYRVEEHLKEVYGDRLGLIVLKKDARNYTLRQVGAFSKALERIYRRLNLIDPAAGGAGSPAQWGGSAEIGGSPRGRGTALSLAQILDACARSCRVPGVAERARVLTLVALVTGAVTLAPLVLTGLIGQSGLVVPISVLTLVLAAGGGLALLGRRPGLIGLRRPAGLSWLLAFPVAAFGIAAGGGWSTGSGASSLGWFALAFAPLAAELLYRGVAFGLVLALVAGQDRRSARWPMWVSGGLYALWTSTLLTFGEVLDLSEAPLRWIGWESESALAVLAVTAAAALLTGLALGWIRERSGSLLPSVLVHLLLAVVFALFF